MSAAALRQFWEESWQRLTAAMIERDHPCRLIQLATQSASGPQLRTVVLRQIDQERPLWLCHTDARSAKIREIEADPRVAALAYDHRIGLQLRVTGIAQLDRHNAACAAAWAALPLSARRLYQVAATGEPLTHADELAGMAHLALLGIRLQTLDLLLLHPDGQRRARYRADQDWRGEWVRP